MAILIHTPLWVWGILLFLLYKGTQQTRTSAIKLWQLFIFPAVFLPLIIISAINALQPLLAMIGLIVGFIVGIFLGYLLWKDNPLISQQNGQWQLRGSYIPLLLYLFIFIFRYAISVIQHLQVSIIQTDLFNLLIGLPTGLGLGLLITIPLLARGSISH